MERPRPSLAFLYGAALILAAFAAFAFLPIVAWDKDLWYHLNGGRWIWEHRALPSRAFFSYLSPPRPWLDYCWLFELGVYAVERAGGFAALVLLRSAMLGATLTAGWALLVGRDARPGWRRAALFSLYAVFLLPRFMLVRPHLFSYFFLAASLLILERRPRWSFVLPLVAVLWGNLHGIYYPVLLLAAGAYAAEAFLRRSKRPEDQNALAFTAAAMAAVFLTPLGAGLIDIPFIPLDYARYHISELAPFSTSLLFSFHFVRWAPTPDTCFALIFWAGILSLAWEAAARRLRPAHAVLLAGGAVLLSRGARFSYEFALLALPLLGRSTLWDAGEEGRWPARRAVLAGLALMPFCAVLGTLSPRPRYPVSPRGLPQGTAAFLKREGGGGRVLGDPAMGGYLEWALGEGWTIDTDMRTPHLFSDADNYWNERAFQDPALLDAELERDRPDFIAAPLARTGFKALIARHPRYVLIFFDDEAALYADAARRPGLVRRWKLDVDPSRLPPPAPKTGAAGCGLPAYLSRMLALAPRTFSTRVYAAQFCSAAGEPAAELDHARELMRDYPEEAEGWLIAGNALRRMGQPARALAALRRALSRAQGAKRATVMRETAAAYRAKGEPSRARDLLRASDPALPPDSWAEPVPGRAGPPPRSRAGARSGPSDAPPRRTGSRSGR